jgi:hypothetical protein
LIRFRRQREHLRFSEEIKLVPHNLVVGTLAALAALILLAMVMCAKDIPASWNIIEDLGRERALIVVGLVGVASAIPIAIIVFLTAYVYRDARRRGMNAGLWVLIVLMLLPAYLATGYILYFTAREPLPYPCPKCRATVSARYNFCPTCKYELHRSCAQCRREISENDRYCPHCGHDQAASQALANARASVGDAVPEARP